MKDTKNIEMRSLDAFSVIENDDGKHLTGSILYNKRSLPLPWIEVIAPTAFNKTLADNSDVKFLYEHDYTNVLGRVKNGSLVLENRADGLYFDCRLPDTQLARDVYELVSNGYVQGISFGFRVIQDEWGWENDTEIRVLKEVQLFEITTCLEPAYPDNKVTNRSLSDSYSNKPQLSEDDKQRIAEEISKLSSLIGKNEEEPASTDTQPEPNETATQEETTEPSDEEKQLIDELNKRLETAQKIIEDLSKES